MAEDSPVKKRLECSICLENYNTTDHLPKALRCQHTFCIFCVDNLAKKPKLLCPKCRQETDKNEVITNFAVMDIVETLCQECEVREHEMTCNHCKRTMCNVCNNAHTEVITKDVMQAMESLSNQLVHLTTVTTDRNILNSEKEKAEDAKMKLSQDLVDKRKVLDDYEQKMFDIFDDIMDENIHAYTVWREDVDIKLAKGRSFIQNAERKVLRRTISKTELINIQQETLGHLKGLKDIDGNRPSMKPFPKAIPKNVVQVPKQLALVDGISPHKVTTTFANGISDTTSVKLKYISGSKGSGPDNFEHACSVTIIPQDEFLAITDYGNGRVKVYDKNMKSLLFMIGRKGSQQMEFEKPCGIEINKDMEVYVADTVNHRVQVFSRYGQFVRAFGKKGYAPGQFMKPMSIAFSNGGLMFVCDSLNYRVQVFMPEGKFVRLFGSKGDSPDQFAKPPVAILKTRKGHLLIAEHLSHAKMFHQDGRYIKTIPTACPKSIGEIKCNDIEEDQYGNLILSDATGRLLVLNADGDYICTIGHPGHLPGSFNNPDGLAVTSDGDIVVCDGQNHRVQILSVCRRWDHVTL